MAATGTGQAGRKRSRFSIGAAAGVPVGANRAGIRQAVVRRSAEGGRSVLESRQVEAYDRADPV